jgi:DNA mismatch repair protein MutS2
MAHVANERTLRDLEFEAVLAQIARLAASPLGRSAIASLAPTADPEAIKKELGRVEEMRQAILEGGSGLTPGPMEELEPLLVRARETTSLGGEDFLAVLKTIESARRLREATLSLDGSYPELREIAERIKILRELEGMIRRSFDEEGELREDASPKLRRLHRRKRSVEEEVQQRLKTFINSPQYAPIIREPIITRRSSRLVVPIKSPFKHELDCVVHDTSDSGQTLYVEPRSVVELNNEIRELESEIRDEKIRILKELTAKLQAESHAIRKTLKALGILDGLYARAQYALKYNCSVPRLNTRGRIRLIGARHPLLDPQTVVPIDISFGDHHQGVLITGPNTGGKTVTLKTIGLLTLMVQSGIPIPADPESEFSVFDVVRSDIGDEQSIQQNLSTFSSHVVNLVEILSEVNERSLVLIDELGAGTDPQEGAALGIAILRYLLQSGARIVVTTHFSALKHFAYRHESLKTCSVEFDVETLMPTYRLVEGVGASNAFYIAERLGLPSEIVQDAKGFLSEGAVKAEELIKLLERERLELSRERARLAEEREAAKQERERFEERLQKLESQVEEELRAELHDLKRVLKETRLKLERAIASARRGTEAELRYQLKQLEQAEAGLKAAERAAKRPAQPLPLKSLKEGMRVLIEPLGQVGMVRAILSDTRVEVDVGGLRVQAKPEDLSLAQEERVSPKPGGKEFEPLHELSSASPGLELNVRGLTVSEALRELDLYLDRLILHEIHKAAIIHGRGTGTLRRAIREFLAADGRVTQFYPAPARQGGDGITIVELK